MKLNPIPRHTHSIAITFTNMVTKLVCLRVTIPINKRQFSISNWYKTTKVIAAETEGIQPCNIKGKHEIIECQDYRILFEFPGGISIDVPADANKYDYSILLAQLEVLKMSAIR